MLHGHQAMPQPWKTMQQPEAAMLRGEARCCRAGGRCSRSKGGAASRTTGLHAGQVTLEILDSMLPGSHPMPLGSQPTLYGRQTIQVEPARCCNSRGRPRKSRGDPTDGRSRAAGEGTAAPSVAAVRWCRVGWSHAEERAGYPRSGGLPAEPPRPRPPRQHAHIHASTPRQPSGISPRTPTFPPPAPVRPALPQPLPHDLDPAFRNIARPFSTWRELPHCEGVRAGMARL